MRRLFKPLSKTFRSLFIDPIGNERVKGMLIKIESILMKDVYTSEPMETRINFNVEDVGKEDLKLLMEVLKNNAYSCDHDFYLDELKLYLDHFFLFIPMQHYKNDFRLPYFTSNKDRYEKRWAHETRFMRDFFIFLKHHIKKGSFVKNEEQSGMVDATEFNPLAFWAHIEKHVEESGHKIKYFKVDDKIFIKFEQ